MPEATVNGIDTHYDLQEEGTPTLFIHGGWGGPASSVVPQETGLTEGLSGKISIHLITYDRRSAGQSQYVVDKFTLADIADDAAALLDHLNMDRAVVIGMSMGGMVAQQFGLDHPDKVIGLCLAGTGADMMSDIDLGRTGKEIVERCASDGDRAVFDSLKDELRNPPAIAVGEPRTPEAEARMQRRNEAVAKELKDISEDDLFRYWTGMIRNYEAFIGVDFTPRLGDLKMPVLVIHGGADTIVPLKYGQALHHGIDKSQIHESEGAGHGVLDYPDALEALRTWLRNVRWLAM